MNTLDIKELIRQYSQMSEEEKQNSLIGQVLSQLSKEELELLERKGLFNDTFKTNRQIADEDNLTFEVEIQRKYYDTIRKIDDIINNIKEKEMTQDSSNRKSM